MLNVTVITNIFYKQYDFEKPVIKLGILNYLDFCIWALINISRDLKSIISLSLKIFTICISWSPKLNYTNSSI